MHLLSQYIISGLVIGVLYCLMALGITFIYSIMKMINWSMGEFYMIGSYIQYYVIVSFLGPRYWYLGVLLSIIGVFLLGIIIQNLLIKPMFVGVIERRDEYATIVTIALMFFFRNLAAVLGGPHMRCPPDYYSHTIYLGTLPISGNRFMAFIGTIFLLLVFYLFVKKTWLGRAFRAAAQNRVAIQTAGVNILRIDQIAFGIGVALAGAAGALLAPIFLVWPEDGAISTMKGFEIIVIGGLGSIPGTIIAGLLLGLIESLGSVFINPSFRDVYGFIFLLVILAVRPWGLLGERGRVA